MPRQIKRGTLSLLLVVGALAMVFPFVWSVVTSLSSGAGLTSTPSLIPDNPSLDAYRTLFSSTDFVRVVLNSIGVAVVVTIAQVSTSALAAYAFTRLRFPGRGAIFAVYLATMMIPMQVLIVPLFVQMRTLGLVDSYAGVIVPSIASAFGVFLLRQSMAVVPKDFDEAATLDGAGHIRIFRSVVLPLIKPALATFAVFSFMSSWNSFLWPLIILRTNELKTLPVALAQLQGQFTTQWDVMMAGSVVSIVPMLLIYIVAQKQVVQGVAGSGLK